MSEIISVVVPVFNVEKYLRKCIDSICSQTYQNLEIILVDDGSTDSSGSLCDTLAKKDSRIKVIHKHNGGLSDARNAGLSIAIGIYICFIDSDDWLEQNILQTAYSRLTQDNTDIAIWSFQKNFVNEIEEIQKNIPVTTEDYICSKEKKDYAYLANQSTLDLLGYAWNKLYKKSLIEKNCLFFEKGTSLVEDILFNSKMISKVSSISFIKDIGTHYIQRNRQTLGTKFYPNHLELKIQACEARKLILLDFGMPLISAENALQLNYFNAVKSTCRTICLTTELSTNQKNKLLSELCNSQSARAFVKKINARKKDLIIKMFFLMKFVKGIMFIYNK